MRVKKVENHWYTLIYIYIYIYIITITKQRLSFYIPFQQRYWYGTAVVMQSACSFWPLTQCWQNDTQLSTHYCSVALLIEYTQTLNIVVVFCLVWAVDHILQHGQETLKVDSLAWHVCKQGQKWREGSRRANDVKQCTASTWHYTSLLPITVKKQASEICHGESSWQCFRCS